MLKYSIKIWIQFKYIILENNIWSISFYDIIEVKHVILKYSISFYIERALGNNFKLHIKHNIINEQKFKSLISASPAIYRSVYELFEILVALFIGKYNNKMATEKDLINGIY